MGSELGLQMPPTGPLSAEEISVLKAWIDQGATWQEATVEETAPPEKAAPPDPKGEPLFQAIHKNDVVAVRDILQKGQLPDKRERQRWRHALDGCGSPCWRGLYAFVARSGR